MKILEVFLCLLACPNIMNSMNMGFAIAAGNRRDSSLERGWGSVHVSKF